MEDKWQGGETENNEKDQFIHPFKWVTTGVVAILPFFLFSLILLVIVIIGSLLK